MTSYRVPAVLTLAVVLVLAAACGGTEEVAPQPTATPTATETTAPTPAATATAPASPTPVATLEPTPVVPADWKTYSDPEGRFTMGYPSGWFVQDGASSKVRPPGELTSIFSSFQPGAVSDFPATAAKVDLYVRTPVAGSDCRSLPEGATAAMLGGVSGWRRLTSETSLGDARSVVVAAYNSGYCYSLTAYFGRDNSDDAVFAEMIDSFAFAGSGSQ